MGYFFVQKKRIVKIAFLALASAFLVYICLRGDDHLAARFAAASREVVIVENGQAAGAVVTKQQKVSDFLAEQKIKLGEKDEVFPEPESALHSQSRILISRARRVSISDGERNKEGYVLGLTVGDALIENGIALGEDDLVDPPLQAVSSADGKIRITRVIIKEEKELKSVDFKKVVREDDKLGWREKKIVQAGKFGNNELTYKSVYHNQKLISRKLVNEEVIEDPVEEISIQGTYVKLGKKHDGMASWYAFRGGMFAANPWLPMGSFVKVTNLDNGKSVIVKINDRGPFVPGRIIDLDKVAFQKIASIGAGVVHVKMEEILN